MLRWLSRRKLPKSRSCTRSSASSPTMKNSMAGWRPTTTVEVRSRVTGHIKKINFTDGQYVKKGDLLFELDPRPFQAEIGKTRDTLESLRSAKDRCRQGRSATANAANQRRRQHPAGRKGRGRCAGPRCPNQRRRKTKLLAPNLTWNIRESRPTSTAASARRRLTEGNLVNAGGSDPLLTTIVSVDPIRIYFNVDERSMQRYAKSIGAAWRKPQRFAGQHERPQGQVQIRAGRRNWLHARRRAADSATTASIPSTGTIQVYGIVPNAKGMFVPGSRVRVRLTIGKPYTGDARARHGDSVRPGQAVTS